MTYNKTYNEALERWEQSGALDHPDYPKLDDKWKRKTVAMILENTALASPIDGNDTTVNMSTSGFEAKKPITVDELNSVLTEAAFAPTNAAGTGGYSGSASATGPVAGFDPVLISLIRRNMPRLMAYDLASVQPLNGPTGLIFALRATSGQKRTATNGVFENELFYNEVPTGFAAQGGTYAVNGDGQLVYTPGASEAAANPSVLNPLASAQVTATSAVAGAGGIAGNPIFVGINDGTTPNQGFLPTNYQAIPGMPTATLEQLGSDNSLVPFREVGFSIEKLTVTAKARALKAEYSLEIAQDLKAIHGLDAEAELANIVATEMMAEINREVVRTIYLNAKAGSQVNTVTPGIFDLDTDSNGRWQVERFKGLLFQIERDANIIGQETRRGRGNILITSADVASALAMASILDYAPALKTNDSIDDNETTFAGVINGRIKVYVDPYSANNSANQFYVCGFKGNNPYDAGIYYCPYVPLQMVRAIGQDTFQPKLGFKTRYGLVNNPFSNGLTQTNSSGNLYDAQGRIIIGGNYIDTNTNLIKNIGNVYFRRVRISNLA